MEQPLDVQDVRVVHFGLGTLGAAIARVVTARDGLVSVAAIDPDPSRAGRDLAEVTGLGAPLGTVVESTSALLGDLEADVVLFAPEGGAEEATTDLEVLLELGLNVVAILPDLAYPPDDDDDLAISIDTLAREAEVTALALDPSDALLGALPLSLTGICAQVDRLVVRQRGVSGAVGRLSLGDWARALANALGWALDDLDEIEEDQGGRPRGHHRIVGSIAGREVLVVDIEADASGGEQVLEVEIEGTPSLRMSLNGGGSTESALATLAVNAIPAVLTSDPGLYTLSDLPPIHCWTSLGLMPADDDEELDDV